MSQVFATWLADDLRAEGCRVKTYEGWKARGRPSSSGSFNPFGVLVHHTGTPSSASNPAPTVGMCIRGRPDLPGPLCQVVVGYDGLCHVIAAGRANHAGTNVGSGPIPAGDGNSQMIGFEVDYSGSQDMGPLQYEATIMASAAVLKHFRKDESYARGHKETSSSGKWDPGRRGSSSPEYRMSDIRAAIKQQLKGELIADETTKRSVLTGIEEGTPVYLIHDETNDLDYCAYDSGLVRRVSATERNQLSRDDVPLINETQEYALKRLAQYDEVLRGVAGS